MHIYLPLHRARVCAAAWPRVYFLSEFNAISARACPESECNGDRERNRHVRCDAHARKIIGPLLYIGYCTIHAHTQRLVTERLAYMQSTMASGGGTFASAKCSSDRTHTRTHARFKHQPAARWMRARASALVDQR